MVFWVSYHMGWMSLFNDKCFMVFLKISFRAIQDFTTNGTVTNVETIEVDAQGKYSIYHHL